MADEAKSKEIMAKHDNVGDIVFYPPLYQKRYAAAVKFLKRRNAKKIVDFGCAECKVMLMVRRIPTVEEMIGVDIDRALLASRNFLLKPLIGDYLSPRELPLRTRLFEGSITDYDSRLDGADAVMMIEVIEHLEPEVLAAFPVVLFGKLHPPAVFISTPNQEFNVLFKNFSGMRHDDHKFEWTRAEFQQWCKGVCSEYSYCVEFGGVGNPPAGRQDVGHCSQYAIFTRQELNGHHMLTNIDAGPCVDTANLDTSQNQQHTIPCAPLDIAQSQQDTVPCAALDTVQSQQDTVYCAPVDLAQSQHYTVHCALLDIEQSQQDTVPCAPLETKKSQQDTVPCAPLDTVQSQQDTVHCAPLDTAQSQHYTVHCALLDIAQSQQDTVPCAPLETKKSEQDTVLCAPLDTAQSEQDTVHCAPLDTAQSQQDTVHCAPLGTAQSQQVTAHCAPLDEVHCAPLDMGNSVLHDTANCALLNNTHCAPLDIAHCALLDSTHCAPVDSTHCAPSDSTHCAPLDPAPTPYNLVYESHDFPSRARLRGDAAIISEASYYIRKIVCSQVEDAYNEDDIEREYYHVQLEDLLKYQRVKNLCTDVSKLRSVLKEADYKISENDMDVLVKQEEDDDEDEDGDGDENSFAGSGSGTGSEVEQEGSSWGDMGRGDAGSTEEWSGDECPVDQVIPYFEMWQDAEDSDSVLADPPARRVDPNIDPATGYDDPDMLWVPAVLHAPLVARDAWDAPASAAGLVATPAMGLVAKPEVGPVATQAAGLMATPAMGLVATQAAGRVATQAAGRVATPAAEAALLSPAELNARLLQGVRPGDAAGRRADSLKPAWVTEPGQFDDFYSDGEMEEEQEEQEKQLSRVHAHTKATTITIAATTKDYTV